MPVYKLIKNSVLFPPGPLADNDGLLAYGGDLSLPRLVNAYRNGIFPWYNQGEFLCVFPGQTPEPGDDILWWCPHRRFVIFPKEIHISRSMKKFLRKTNMYVKINENFSQVINACKKAREKEGTWLGTDMEAAYNAMFSAGYAMCAGVYNGDTLVGGLYGVVMDRCFFGESMFSNAPNASKLALIRLCEVLHDFAFIDCQFHTPHLEKMGGRYISWNEYHRLMREGQS